MPKTSLAASGDAQGSAEPSPASRKRARWGRDVGAGCRRLDRAGGIVRPARAPTLAPRAGCAGRRRGARRPPVQRHRMMRQRPPTSRRWRHPQQLLRQPRRQPNPRRQSAQPSPRSRRVRCSAAALPALLALNARLIRGPGVPAACLAGWLTDRVRAVRAVAPTLYCCQHPQNDHRRRAANRQHAGTPSAGPLYDAATMRPPRYEGPGLRLLSWNVAGMRALVKKVPAPPPPPPFLSLPQPCTRLARAPAAHREARPPPASPAMRSNRVPLACTGRPSPGEAGGAGGSRCDLPSGARHSGRQMASAGGCSGAGGRLITISWAAGRAVCALNPAGGMGRCACRSTSCRTATSKLPSRRRGWRCVPCNCRRRSCACPCHRPATAVAHAAAAPANADTRLSWPACSVSITRTPRPAPPPSPPRTGRPAGLVAQVQLQPGEEGLLGRGGALPAAATVGHLRAEQVRAGPGRRRRRRGLSRPPSRSTRSNAHAHPAAPCPPPALLQARA
jgi:hypothetical protein